MKKFLIVGPSWVGDMVMSQALFKLLKQRYPNCIIDVVAPDWSLPILERMPEVNRKIALGIKSGVFGIQQRKTLGKSLIKENYTHSITLPRSWKSALVPYFAKAKKRTGFIGEQRYFILNDWRKLNKKTLDQTVKRYVALGLNAKEDINAIDIPQPKLNISLENFNYLQASLSLDKERPAIALMPGAEYGPAKQWPLQHFQQLAEALVKQGFQVWVLGSAKDKPAGDFISQINHAFIYNLCGKTQLADTVDLLSQVQHAVSNDSGLMHVAAAVSVKIHAIYGSSSPNYTPPLTDNKIIYNLNLDCSPCFKKVCPLGHTNCLKDINEDTILNGIYNE